MRKINIEQYKTHLYFTDNIDDFNKKTGNDYKVEDFDGLCAAKGGEIIVGVFNSQVSTLSHEIFHAVMRLSERIGSPVDMSTDEHNAYMTGYLMNKILKLKRSAVWILK